MFPRHIHKKGRKVIRQHGMEHIPYVLLSVGLFVEIGSGVKSQIGTELGKYCQINTRRA